MAITQSKIIFIGNPFGDLTVGSIAPTHTILAMVGRHDGGLQIMMPALTQMQVPKYHHPYLSLLSEIYFWLSYFQTINCSHHTADYQLFTLHHNQRHSQLLDFHCYLILV